MSHELLYTSSAAKGLFESGRGFCTVMATEGLSEPLRKRLESLSGYRHPFMPDDPKYAHNPVVYSHLRIPDRSRNLHLLSRIADFGLDYSNRTNKLAHHVLLEPQERAPGGPAWLLAQPSLMQSNWDQQVLLKRVGRTVPSGDPPLGPARRWKDMTGDAGWAGVLAETTLADPSRLVYLIFSPGQELLPLFAEAVALLPPPRRWEATFTTYLNGLPQDVRCAWRGVLKGTPEESEARRSRGSLVLDLTQPLGVPPESRGVEAARAGTLLTEPSRETPPTLPPTLGDSKSRAADGAGRDDLYHELSEPEPASAPRMRRAVSSASRPPARLGEPVATELPPELPPAIGPQPVRTSSGLTLTISKEVLALAVLVVIAITGIVIVKVKDGLQAQSGPGGGPAGEAGQTHTATLPTGGDGTDSKGNDPAAESPTTPRETPNSSAATNTPGATERETLTFQVLMSMGRERPLNSEDFVTAFKEQKGTNPGRVQRVSPRGESSGGTLVSSTPGESRSQVLLKAAPLPDGGREARQSLSFEVEFASGETVDFLVEVTVRRTRFHLRLSEGSLTTQKPPVKVEELAAAKFQLKEGEAKWNPETKLLACEFKPESPPDGRFDVIGTVERPEASLRLLFRGSVDPPTLSLARVDVTSKAPDPTPPATPPSTLPLAKAVEQGTCEVVFEDLSEVRLVDGALTLGEFPQTMSGVRFSLYQPEETFELESDSKDSMWVRFRNEPTPPYEQRLGRLQFRNGGKELLFESPVAASRQFPTLPECALRVSGSGDRLIVFCAPAESLRPALVSKDGKVRQIALQSELFQKVRDIGVWRLLLQDPLAKDPKKWLLLERRKGNLHQWGKSGDSQEISLRNIEFTLIPVDPTAPEPMVKLQVNYPEDWGLERTRSELLTRMANEASQGSADQKRMKALQAQRDLLEFVHPKSPEGGPRKPPPEFRVCALGYSRLDGPSASEESSSLLVLRVVVGMSLKELGALNPAYLATTTGGAAREE